MYNHEKIGGLPREERRIEMFRQTLINVGLIDMGFTGSHFTWERGLSRENNIRECLDRCIANED